MKYFSYANRNHNYTRAISLKNIRAVNIYENDGKSAIRYGIKVVYINGSSETFAWLLEDEAKKVFETIVNLLNKA